MAAGGENRWPYLGRNRWPLTRHTTSTDVTPQRRGWSTRDALPPRSGIGQCVSHGARYPVRAAGVTACARLASAFVPSFLRAVLGPRGRVFRTEFSEFEMTAG